MLFCALKPYRSYRKDRFFEMINKPRGTMDIMPEETPLWLHIEKTLRKTAKKYGFSEIRFPTFEYTELFNRGVGDTTDVVQKEMYTFPDRENRSLTLRPEGTACVVRSLIENGRCSDTMPIRVSYLINCFRYEKPQAGRSREFYQFGVEMFGAASPAADASIIALADALISSLGINNAKLHINSIGCPECRPAYHDALKAYFSENSAELCDTCKGRLETNPLRILDCKSPVCSAIAQKAPRTVDHLCPACAEHFETLKKTLEGMGIEYEVDTGIVRGLDYYTRTVFEFIAPVIGAQSTLLGGGRYDGLMKQLGGPELPGIGFAMGITRLILAMKESGFELDCDDKPDIYIAPMGENASYTAASICEKLRRMGARADTDLCGRSLKAQMKFADKTGARYTLIIGESEIESGRAQLKCMGDSTQSEVSLADVDALYGIICGK